MENLSYHAINIIKIKVLLTIAVVSVSINQTYAQSNRDYYKVIRDGKKRKKIVGYIMPESAELRKVKGKKSIRFYVNKSILEHNPGEHKLDTCSVEEIDKIKLTTLSELGKLELEEHWEAVKEAGIVDLPPPPNHHKLKVYLLEKLDELNYMKYEVEWLYVSY